MGWVRGIAEKNYGPFVGWYLIVLAVAWVGLIIISAVMGWVAWVDLMFVVLFVGGLGILREDFGWRRWMMVLCGLGVGVYIVLLIVLPFVDSGLVKLHGVPWHTEGAKMGVAAVGVVVFGLPFLALLAPGTRRAFEEADDKRRAVHAGQEPSSEGARE